MTPACINNARQGVEGSDTPLLEKLRRKAGFSGTKSDSDVRSELNFGSQCQREHGSGILLRREKIAAPVHPTCVGAHMLAQYQSFMKYA